MIEIKVTGDTPLEVLSSLTAFGCRCMKDEDVAVAANHIYEAEMEKAGLLKADQPLTKARVEGNPTPPPAPVKEADVTPPDSPAGTTQPKDLSDSAPAEAPGSSREAPAEAPGSSREAPAEAPSLEEVRDAGIKASRKYGPSVVKAILENFGVANMTSLAETDRAAFLEKLKGLGEGDA